MGGLTPLERGGGINVAAFFFAGFSSPRREIYLPNITTSLNFGRTIKSARLACGSEKPVTLRASYF